MRIWILIFSAALFVGGTCLGVALQPKLQPPPRVAIKAAPQPSWDPGRRSPTFSVTRFATDLKLTEEQDLNLDTILSDSQEEIQALGRAMKAAQDRSRDRITALLSPDQKKQLDVLLAAERQKRAESEISRTVASYQKILTLNDEQAQAMRAVLLEARNRRHEGFKPGSDHARDRKAARDDQNKALEKAFSPDQYKRYLEVSELERFER
jgi:hypothetical protein